MTYALNRAIVAIVGVAAIACVIVVVVLRPKPVPESAGARVTALSRSWRPSDGPSYALDTVVVHGRQHPFTDPPESIGRADVWELHGWAFDPALRRSADRFVYRIDGGAWYDAQYHLGRPDVAAIVGLQAVADCGFDFKIVAATLAPGRHRVEMATQSAGGRPALLPKRPIIDVR